MRRSVLISATLLVITFATQTYAAGQGTNLSSTDSLPLKILDSIPRPDAGISSGTGIFDDTAFAVLIESRFGMNPADPDRIRFTIDDGVHYAYQRNLESDTVRIVEVADTDPRRTLVWAVYERSLESYLPPVYFSGIVVQITVQVADIRQHRLSPQQFRFKIESDPGPEAAFERLPESDFIDADDLTAEATHDSGIEVLSGELAGAKILYSSAEPLTPGFGPVGAIEPVDSEEGHGVGVPVNLIPHTVFQSSVKIFFPCPEGTDISDLGIFYHNGSQWLAAADAHGNVLPGGIGWMVPGSRIDHYEPGPPVIEIEVYHFSAVQGGVVVVSQDSNNDKIESDGSGAHVFISCFIDTAVSGGISFISLLSLLSLLPLLNALRCIFQRI